eukprot:SAG11_NODE_280_length_11266_cov_28.949499_9_plen_122_part_00
MRQEAGGRRQETGGRGRGRCRGTRQGNGSDAEADTEAEAEAASSQQPAASSQAAGQGRDRRRSITASVRLSAWQSASGFEYGERAHQQAMCRGCGSVGSERSAQAWPIPDPRPLPAGPSPS